MSAQASVAALADLAGCFDELARALVERQRNNLRWNLPAANFDGDDAPWSSLATQHIAHANRFAQARSHCAARQRANWGAVAQNRVGSAWHTAIGQFDTDEFTAQTLRFFLQQRIATDEVHAFVQLDRPAKSGFERRDRLRQLMIVETIACFQPQRIAGAQACGEQPFRLASLQQRIPQIAGLLVEAGPIFLHRASVDDDHIETLATAIDDEVVE